MRKLTVKNFSVIKDAELEFGKITVLIGPQSSGKSLLCKLAYFLQNVVLDIAQDSIRAERSFEDFRLRVPYEFSNNWFPAFGSEANLKVTFTDGAFEVSFGRTSSAGSDGPGIMKSAPANFSVGVEEAYTKTLSELQLEKRSSGSADPTRYARQIRELLEELKASNSGVYSYIPSTRSFFVTPQKAILGTSQRLDPITVRFSQDFSFDYRERVPKGGLSSELTTWIDERALGILQGEVKVIGNFEFFKARDGREIPLAYLSSGTQELLPLITCLREFVGLSSAVDHLLHLKKALHRRLFFLEEPETSVFPSTQNDLVRIFARMSNEPTLDASWVVTTHSPYVLSSFNNLLEAWQTSHIDEQRAQAVRAVIDEKYWLNPDEFRAYAIEDGVLISIVAKDTRLISENYLDSVSETIGAEFDELLRIGYVEA